MFRKKQSPKNPDLKDLSGFVSYKTPEMSWGKDLHPVWGKVFLSSALTGTGRIFAA